MVRYRTMLVAVLGMALLSICALQGVKGEDLANVKWGLVGIVGLVAGRAVGEKAAGGPGIRTMAKVLLTDAKPPPADAPPAPAGTSP